MLNRHVMTTSALALACGASVAVGIPDHDDHAPRRMAIGVPAELVDPDGGKDGKGGKGGGYIVDGVNCATTTEVMRHLRQLAEQYPTRANINDGTGLLNFAVPWDIQLNGEALLTGNRTYEPFALWADDTAIESIGDPTPDIYPGTDLVIPYRIVEESWFEGTLDIDVIPPIENSDPPFPGFPFEGMEVPEEVREQILDAMNIIEAATNLDFVEVEPRLQTDAVPRGTPILLIAMGATADEPFDSDAFLKGTGASFSISVGMRTGPVCMIGPYGAGSTGVETARVSVDPIISTQFYFQVLDEEEIPTDDMGDFITLPGWNPGDWPSIPAGRLPVLDVDDLDGDGVAADLGDADNPGVMWVDWEPRPFMDRRFADTAVEDIMGIEDFDRNDIPDIFDGFLGDLDGNPSGIDELEGMEISPFTGLVILHPNLEQGGANSRSVIIHELMHAIGFNHEHQRHDRDDFVEILEQNVDPESLDQFTLMGEASSFGEYDFESIMHYGPFAFSSNGDVTIDVLQQWEPLFGNVIGTALTLSRGDAAALRELYGAPDCPEDLDGDFQVDLDDWFLFLDYFVANDFRADINLDGLVDIGDLVDFVEALAGRSCFAPQDQPPTLPGFGDTTDPF